MPRERTIKGPAKRGTILNVNTHPQEKSSRKDMAKQKVIKAGRAAKKSARSGKQHTSSTSNKKGNRT